MGGSQVSAPESRKPYGEKGQDTINAKIIWEPRPPHTRTAMRGGQSKPSHATPQGPGCPAPPWQAGPPLAPTRPWGHRGGRALVRAQGHGWAHLFCSGSCPVAHARA